MNAIAEVLEQELEGAFEVKDKKSLHRYIVLLTENIVKKENYEKQQSELTANIKFIAESMKQGFEHMNKRFEDMQHYMEKRFEAVDKRFEDVNKRFSMMFAFMNIGFGIIILLTILFKFIA